MKKMKILIIALCIIIVILLIGILVINKDKNQNDKIILDEQTMGIGEFSKDIIETCSYSEWLQVKQCINIYLNTINKENSAYYGFDKNNNYVKVVKEIDIKKKIYSVLSKEYIEKNEINIENVYNYIDDVSSNQNYTILNLKKVVNSNTNNYIIQGFVEENNKLKGIKNFIVNFNLRESAFSIEPIKQNIDFSNINIKNVEIEKNNYNSIPKVLANTENIIKEYFNTLKKLILVYPEKAYEYLDVEYKNTRFQKIEDFKEYINNNLERYSTMYVEKYQKENINDYIRYICLDKKGNYYIFKETELLNFSIILDTYTIDLPEFTKKYNSGTNQVKVGMNIQKIIDAINEKDYKYVYNKLDDTFKKNTFKNINNFENYVRNNFYDNNDVEYTEFTDKGDTFIYKLKVKDSDNKKSKEKELTVIMKLEEGTDFVMSFNVK